MPETTGVSQQANRDRYLEGDRSFNIRNHMENLEKEEKNGLKGIEIRSTVKSLGKDDFLKLLITQLSSQDPTNPVKDQDFIAQMAQFSSLEQMSNISTGIQKMGNRQSFSLVGKLVSGPDFVTGENVAGIAGALFFDGEGKTFVRVNGRSIDVEQISLISDPTVLKEQEAAYNQAQVQQNQIGPSKSNTAGTTEMTTNAPHAKTEIPLRESPASKVSPNLRDAEIQDNETESASEKQGEVGVEQQIQKKGVAEKKTSDWEFPGKNKSSSY
ncbi:flagellar hook capping FlgD N-terminal domain-containing protein [Leptospira santarosai]|uniref:Basal-body rod modification protein FlgD n=1 Tax=Leptospira santarosai serovar Arenal str. MAVJ 401 TaxID=1049976 RepID=M6JIG1_9LEPT|nr:flagellar hook capping FlgD N-terminal domain-containing protein [Leptospira santarosai]EMF92704.1 putative flagellar hook capping protein [Leptospira santarosai str. ST188]EMN21471.1 putative flagellar hook capping protein [Leptospira santarosai serovar Arenal str. MAVJ 401]MDI7185586.1 flagellar hook capping FlgD N-terminal domain-containing protein [Leptospira santarosai]MDI7198539.1 flagellar hook capping FlgD N-terminal domain-containing protein [Leptospira santarosai]MDI7214406.1 flag